MSVAQPVAQLALVRHADLAAHRGGVAMEIRSGWKERERGLGEAELLRGGQTAVAGEERAQLALGDAEAAGERWWIEARGQPGQQKAGASLREAVA